MQFSLPRFYPITDTHLTKLSHAEQVRRFAAAGASFVQLREKTAPPREFYLAAKEAVAAAKELGVNVIVNDRVDIAIAVEAAGVHLGQDDMPPEAARRILGPARIIGFSTHRLEQALEADQMPIDYIALGPVFNTSTKENPDPVVGLGSLRYVRSCVSKPLVAIGGISLQNAASVIEAGADSIAVISDLFSGEEVANRVRRFVDVLEGR
jgi:thiamine-phosphate pyrophosphorylase